MKGSSVTTAMPSIVSSITGRDARLWMNGSFLVRIMCMTSVCVHMDSMNQPVWNSAANLSCIAGLVSCAKVMPPHAIGAITKYSSRYVAISKIELTGPIQSMKRLMPDASHVRGTLRYSASTLSHGIAVQEMS